MPRTEFSATTKRDARTRANGHCEKCGAPLRDGHIHFDHEIPDALGGDATLENCRCLCRTCHDRKTAIQDIPRIAKAKRQADRAAGIKPRKGRPMPGTRASGLRKRMDGTVERRTDT